MKEKKDLRSNLTKFLLTQALTCIHQPKGMLKHRYVIPTCSAKPGADDHQAFPERSRLGHYLQMYDWDACFFCQGVEGISGLAADVVANFLTLEQPDGYIPRTVSGGRIWDQGDMCKPFLAQTIEQEWKKESTKPLRLTGLLEKLDSYLGYYRRYRRHRLGLYRWRNVLESGVDNNLALIAPREAAKDETSNVYYLPDRRLLCVDLSSYLVMEYQAMWRLYLLNQQVEKAAYYQQLSLELINRIEHQLWSDKLSMYCNLDPRTGELIEVRSWTGLLPVMLGFADKNRAVLVIEKNLLCEEHFLRPAGLSSLAVSEKLYNQALRGLYGRAVVSNWQGPVWILPNVLAVRGLKQYGYKRQSYELANRVVATLSNALEGYGTLHENYNAENGEPLWAPQFMSWNILALELIKIVAP